MLRARKRITRKDLRQPDQFITLTSRFFRYFEEHRTRILLILGLGIGLSLAIWGWNLYRAQQERLASEEYSVALRAFHNGQYETALDLLERLRAYPRSNFSRLALLYRAHSHIALKRPSEAVPVLEELLSREGKGSYLRQAALLTLGHAHEMAARCADAVNAFDQAAKLEGPLQEDALLAKARCSAQSGDLTGALNAYRDYLSRYPGSGRFTEISLRVQEIEGKLKGVSESKGEQ